MAICCVSEKIQTAYVCLNTLRVLVFFAFLHLTIFERPAYFEFFNSQLNARILRSGFNRLDDVQINPVGVPDAEVPLSPIFRPQLKDDVQ